MTPTELLALPPDTIVVVKTPEPPYPMGPLLGAADAGDIAMVAVVTGMAEGHYASAPVAYPVTWVHRAAIFGGKATLHLLKPDGETP